MTFSPTILAFSQVSCNFFLMHPVGLAIRKSSSIQYLHGLLASLSVLHESNGVIERHLLDHGQHCLIGVLVVEPAD
jgi:hypothetical protein